MNFSLIWLCYRAPPPHSLYLISLQFNWHKSKDWIWSTIDCQHLGTITLLLGNVLPGDGNLKLKRRKNEGDEEVKWGAKCASLLMMQNFQKKNLSGQMYDIKCIFGAYRIFIVHIPFKSFNISFLSKIILGQHLF